MINLHPGVVSVFNDAIAVRFPSSHHHPNQTLNLIRRHVVVHLRSATIARQTEPPAQHIKRTEQVFTDMNGVRLSSGLKLYDFHDSPQILSLDAQRHEVRHTTRTGICTHETQKPTSRFPVFWAQRGNRF
jgi:hypothetical protein